MKQCNLTKGLVVFLTIMITLFCGVMPSAWADGCDDCEGEDFEGCYGFWHEGKMITPLSSGEEVSTASVGVLHFGETNCYGIGEITGHETVSVGPPASLFPTFYAEIIGTYTVNSDCTGTAVLCTTPVPLEPPILIPTQSVIAFVITSKGKEIQVVTTKMNASCLAPGVLEGLVSGNITPINIVGTIKNCDD